MLGPDSLYRKGYKKVWNPFCGLGLLDTFPDLSSLPLGALRRAQYALRTAEVASESESDDESNRSNFSQDKLGSQSKGSEKPEWSLKPKSEIPRRPNKHAYVSMQ